MSVKGVETEIKLKLSSFPVEIKHKGSVRIHQTYYDTKNPDVLTVVKDILAQHLSADQISNCLGSATEIRTRMTLVRPNAISYKMTIKSDGDLTRGETEVEIDRLHYDILRTTYAEIGSVIKARYTIDLPLRSGKTNEVKNLVIELDDYDHDFYHEDLVTAEVEFDPTVFNYREVVDGATHHIVQNSSCKVVIHDITFDKQYKNRNLAVSAHKASQSAFQQTSFQDVPLSD
ncbi:CYTH domain-containing protein [Yasminevirus sp. GU-2018]|uniref:CYTH domain-containing protein n=1 Tax=Yasminevirus sp. GU-2018 TaxID=2420051 RepID=A0A5K0UA66_9VIRU|nr:CYTH domain-containing protein [Yasminevirus sp. GU-2018]